MAEFDVVFGKERGSFVRWKVKQGSSLHPGSVVAMVELENGDTDSVKTSRFGTVLLLYEGFNKGDKLTKGTKLIRMKGCEHTVVVRDMCADCGTDLRQESSGHVWSEAKVAMVHSVPELHVTEEEAKKQGLADQENLLKLRKLVLLVDLDQTLIHTTNEDVNPKLKDVEHFQLRDTHGGRGFSPWYHTRLRPYTREFLRNISQYFELHICTFGVRLYAQKVARILDHDGQLFSHRILSRDECFDPNLKAPNLKALFPCGDHMVCIIDDREDVWNYARNVVHVKPYRYFKHTGDINAPPGFNKTDENTEHQFQFKHPLNKQKDEEIPEEEQGGTNRTTEKDTKDTKDEETSEDTTEEEKTNTITDEEPIEEGELESSEQEEGKFPDVQEEEEVGVKDEDEYLYYLEKILKRIHGAFYQIYEQKQEADMKTIVPYVRSKVLKGCNVVFSGVIPTNQKDTLAPIYRAALAFGAKIHDRVVFPDSTNTTGNKDGSVYAPTVTTHLVAAKMDTKKYHEAKRNGKIHLVSPQWLWCCVERWERVDEMLFPITDVPFSPLSAATGGFHYHQIPPPSLVHSGANSDLKPVDHSSNLESSNPNLTSNQADSPEIDSFPSTLDSGVSIPSTCSVSSQSTEATLVDEQDGESSVDSVVASARVAERHLAEFPSFSQEQLGRMSSEVDDALSDEEEEEEIESEEAGNGNADGSSSETDSISGTVPKGWKRRSENVVDGEEWRQKKMKRTESDSSDSGTLKGEREEQGEETSGDSLGSIDDEMAAAVEREFAQGK